MVKNKLEFHSPYCGDWVVVVDSITKEEIYRGHRDLSVVWTLLDHYGIEVDYFDYPDEEYGEKF